MIVAELIQELLALDPQLEVIIEGCDCWNRAAAVHVGPDWTEDNVPRPGVAQISISI